MTVSAVFYHSLWAERSPEIKTASISDNFSLINVNPLSKSFVGVSHLRLPYSGAIAELVLGKPCSSWQQIGKSQRVDAPAV